MTWTLRELLAHEAFKTSEGPSLIYASIPGPKMISKALEAGVGGIVRAEVGAAVDNRFAPPIELEGTVRAIHKGDKDAKVEVVIQTGSLQIIVTQKRKPYHHLSDFTQLGLNPKTIDILAVKIGYLVPELYDIRGDWVMALTPGGSIKIWLGYPIKIYNVQCFPLIQRWKPNLAVRWVPQSI